MTCRAIEQMLKEVEEKARLRNIRVLHGTTGLSYEELFEVLEVPKDSRPKYLVMLMKKEKQNG